MRNIELMPKLIALKAMYKANQAIMGPQNDTFYAFVYRLIEDFDQATDICFLCADIQIYYSIEFIVKTERLRRELAVFEAEHLKRQIIAKF